MKIIGAAVVILALLIMFTQSDIFKNSDENQGQTNTQANMSLSPVNLEIVDVSEGTGPAAKPGDMLTVHYVGTLENGTQFDSSYQRQTPFQFQLGAGSVIRGWDEGLVGMKAGGKRELVIPPSMGYGSQTVGPIPANSVLRFTVELITIGS